jgi:hypothetical protein
MRRAPSLSYRHQAKAALMARYIQKISFGVETEWWVGWEIHGPHRQIDGLVPADEMSPEDLLACGVRIFQPITLSLLKRVERRKIHRIRLQTPFHGSIGSTSVMIVDLSAGGVGIAHEHPLRPGRIALLAFSSPDRRYAMNFEILRCQLTRGDLGGREALYYSCLRLRSTDPADGEALRDLVVSFLQQNETQIRTDPTRALALA